MVQTSNLLKATSYYKKITLFALGQRYENVQAADIQETLEAANLWGPPTAGPVSDAIFGAIDRAQYTGKINATLIVDNKLNVKIQVQPPAAAKVQLGLQNFFGPRMTNALKRAKLPPPFEKTIAVPWLEDVGY